MKWAVGRYGPPAAHPRRLGGGGSIALCCSIVVLFSLVVVQNLDLAGAKSVFPSFQKQRACLDCVPNDLALLHEGLASDVYVVRYSAFHEFLIS